MTFFPRVVDMRLRRQGIGLGEAEEMSWKVAREVSWPVKL